MGEGTSGRDPKRQEDPGVDAPALDTSNVDMFDLDDSVADPNFMPKVSNTKYYFSKTISILNSRAR